MPVGDDLTVILFVFGLAVTAAFTALSLIEKKRKNIIVTLFLIAFTLVAVGAAWIWLKDQAPKISMTIGQIAGSPVSWFVTLMFLAGAILFGKKGDKRTIREVSELMPLESKATLVENIYLVAGLTPQTTSTVLLLAQIKSPTARLRIVIEHSHHYRSLGSAGWTKPRQVHVADLKDLIKGQDIRITIASRNLESHDVWWGGEGDAAGNLITDAKSRAQIRFIDDKNDEQFYRFFLIRTSFDKPPYGVEIFGENELL